MSRRPCPSCGAPYNGRKCRKCLYENFTEEITHGNHVHEGEPLVIDSPVRKPIRRKDPFGCEEKTRKKSGRKVVLGLLLAIFLFTVELLSDFPDISRSLRRPEPVPIPENCAVLYDDGQFSVYAQWDQGQTFDGSIPIYVQNRSDEDLSLHTRYVEVNGMLLEYSGLSVSPDSGTTEKTTFYLSDRDRTRCGIETVETVTFYLELYPQGDYENILAAEPVTLRAAADPDAALFRLPQGETVYDRDGIRVTYLGYEADAYHPEEFSEGNLLFYVENQTYLPMQLYLTETALNGASADFSLWFDMPPYSRGVTGAFLYGTEDLGLTDSRDLQSVSFRLHFGQEDTFTESDLIQVREP